MKSNRTRTRLASWVAIAGLIGLAACSREHDLGSLRFHQTLSRDVDVLIVVDDSGPMADLLPEIAGPFGDFAGAIASGASSFHIGFITSDLGAGAGLACGSGDGGAFVSSPSCMSGPFLSSVGGAHNYPGTLADAISCVFPTKVGCAMQQPFAATRAALSAAMATATGGFLRPEADLAVVFVGAQDDCSLAPGSNLSGAGDAGTSGVSSIYACTQAGIMCGYAPLPAAVPATLAMCASSEDQTQLLTVTDTREFLMELKSDQHQVFVGVVAGPTTPFTIEPGPADNGAPAAPILDPSCVGTHVQALPPIRIQQLADEFGPPGLSTSICGLNLPSQLAVVGRSISARARCLVGTPWPPPPDGGTTAAADTSGDGGATRDGGFAGWSPDCDVTFTAATDAEVTSIPLASCAATAPPCWHLVPNAAACPATGWQIDVDFGPSGPPVGSLDVDCVGRLPPS